MTPLEILQALNSLKDAFGPHDPRRYLLDRLEVALAALPMEKIVEVERPVEKIIEREKVVEVTHPAPGDRRDEPRDPGELEQHQAEKLKWA